jgi:MFS family permease
MAATGDPAITASKRAILLLGSTLTVMVGALISPALPEMQAVFAATPRVRWLVPLVLTLPSLVIVVVGLGAGYLADRYGARTVLAASLALYGVAGSAGLWVDSLEALLVSRAVFGLAIAGVVTANTTLTADYFEGGERQRFMGLQAACMGLSGVVFALAGGGLADLSWRGPFALYLAAFLLLPGVLFALHAPARTGAGRVRSRGARTPIAWLELGLVLALAFVAMVLFFLIPVQVPFYIAERTGGGPRTIGLLLALFNVCAAGASLRYRQMRLAEGPATISIALFGLVAAGYFLLAMARDPVAIAAALLVGGVGFGMLIPHLSVWLTDRAPERLRGRFVGALSTSFYLGQFVSPLLAHPLIGDRGRATVFLAAAALSGAIAIAFAVGWLGRRGGRAD